MKTGVYVFTHNDDKGFVVTDGNTVEEFIAEIKEHLDLHFGNEEYSVDVAASLHLSFTNVKHATHLQTNS